MGQEWVRRVCWCADVCVCGVCTLSRAAVAGAYRTALVRTGTLFKSHKLERFSTGSSGAPRISLSAEKKTPLKPLSVHPNYGSEVRIFEVK